MNAQLEQKLANASYEEEEWRNIKFNLSTTCIEDKVILNVGGSKYTTTGSTLTCMGNPFFTLLFSEQGKLERDPNDNSIFINRNGTLFEHILEYFRTNTIHSDIMTNEPLRQRLIIEAEYFCIHNLIYILTEPERKRQQEEEKCMAIDKGFPGGTLLQTEHKMKFNDFYDQFYQNSNLLLVEYIFTFLLNKCLCYLNSDCTQT
ncbi:unnamed protein product [Adineta steineri]|uniref:BTB domain-containing protein n=1 Tax=Adineta steineri TaxID=433720 RepID=A0A815TQB1_9BILA|nr:unnamed protein product [Adineta steineri]CAF1412327.1 unnamed protein product [Adineta steineri]CAF1503916.1 unnamed protein product [Adineta steineri]